MSRHPTPDHTASASRSSTLVLGGVSIPEEGQKILAAQFHVETGPTVSTCFHTAFNIMGGGDGEGKSKREVNPVSEMENWKVR